MGAAMCQGPRVMCVVCEHTEVPPTSPVCSPCADRFDLVDEQEPELGARKDQPRRIQIGPTDI